MNYRSFLLIRSYQRKELTKYETNFPSVLSRQNGEPPSLSIQNYYLKIDYFQNTINTLLDMNHLLLLQKKLLLKLVFYTFSLISWGQYPYQNPDLSSEERAKDLISRLTLEEKSALMCDQSDAIPRLGIKKFNWWSEALHGYANNDSVTVFPEPIGMAASFDEKLVYRIFDAVSDEARAKYNLSQQRGQENRRFLSLSVWTPNINIVRDPRWGRGQETYGEDPYLTSRLGLSVVKGLQGPGDERYRKLLACAKHYAVHSGPEWSRHKLNLNDVNPRELYETYLPAFKTLVQEADVRQVMCAYQRLDDEPCCGNTRLLQRILREEWGYRYMVVSDCGAITDFFNTHKVSSDAVHAASKGVLAGTDLECVWDNYPYNTLPEAVERGLLKEEDVDKSLMRILIGRFDLGEMDPDEIVPWAHIPASIINNEEHRQLALDMARETLTLLQNKNNILPLSKTANKIAVIGPNANDKPMLWGNYNGTPIHTISILDGISSKVSTDKILYDIGCDLVEDKATASYFDQCSFEGKKGFKASYWNNPEREGELVITKQIENPIKLTTAGQHEFASGVKLEGFSAIYETEFAPAVTEELVFKGGATGYFELLVNGETLQSYQNWRTLPSRIPYTFEAGKKYKIEIRYTQLHNWQANIELNFYKEVDVDYTDLINMLEDIDLVVFVGGLSGRLEGEEMPVSYPGFKGGDRTNIELPSVQRNCLKTLKEAGKKLIFVNCSGSAIALTPEIETCDAILQAWYGGESGGQAVADVLFGDYNPAGKLPVTFYKSSDQLNDFEDYSMKGRTYRYMNDALFPFGYGLSYTTFNIGTATLNKTSIKADESIQLTIPVTNSGKQDGTEIVQVYVRKVDDIEGPLKSLKGFQRVEIPAGKKSKAIINLPPSSFEFYDWNQRKMAVTPGEYEIYYGSSSASSDLKKLLITIQ
jgi:beta-glucosidase